MGIGKVSLARNCHLWSISFLVALEKNVALVKNHSNSDGSVMILPKSSLWMSVRLMRRPWMTLALRFALSLSRDSHVREACRSGFGKNKNPGLC